MPVYNGLRVICLFLADFLINWLTILIQYHIMKCCKFLILLFLSALLLPEYTKGQQSISVDDYPLIGAQVFIEPGQTEEETEGWFRTMRDNGMSVCRIRMFESYMRKPGGWDFSSMEHMHCQFLYVSL